jgi:lipoprotein-anchoring transpeptidase ErfK/SrfK
MIHQPEIILWPARWGCEVKLRSISRREFLRLSAISMPLLTGLPAGLQPIPGLPLGRVAVRSVEVRREPDPGAPSVRALPRDLIVQIAGTVEAEKPSGNPRWLQVEGGYLHSGDIQPVEYHPQNPAQDISGTVPAEVCVPITQSYRAIVPREEILYRLYYKSVHWVDGFQVDTRSRIWYSLRDPQLGVSYYAPGEHLRLIPPGEYAPLSTDISPYAKWIDVNLGRQLLTAYEDTRAMREIRVSSGMPLAGQDTLTPAGTFYVQNKVIGMHMGDGRLTPDPHAYELPGVPWVCIFKAENGVAFHGTYWHNDFGRARSHGCLNMSPDDALWLYRWTAPPAPDPRTKGTIGQGTKIFIH